MHRRQLAAATAIVVIGAVAIGLAQGAKPSRAAASSEAVPLTHFDAVSILAKYNIPLVEKADLTEPARSQIGYEQMLWRRVGTMIVPCGTGAWCMKANPSQPAFLEWQGLAGDKSDRGATALNALIEPGNIDNIGVFVFMRKAVEGREARFAAQELVPVIRQLFLEAAARAPGKVMLSVPLPGYNYDFSKKALVLAAAGRTSYASYEKRQPGELLTLQNRSVFDDQPIPAPAGERAVYLLGQLPGEPENDSPARYWRNMSRGSGAVLPYVSMIATDRQLRVEAIPMDAAKAEKIIKERPPLTARVYITIDGAQIVDPRSSGRRVRDDARAIGILLARVDRIEVVGAGEETLGAIPAAQLPAAAADTPKASTTPTPGVPQQSPTGRPQPHQPAPAPVAPGDEQALKARIRTAEAEVASLREMLSVVCRQTAARTDSDVKSVAYRRAYSACMR